MSSSKKMATGSRSNTRFAPSAMFPYTPPILLCVVSHNLTVPSNKRVDATPHFVDSEAFCLISPLVSNEIELTRPNLSKSIENPLKSIESFENEYCDGNVERLVIAQCT